MIYHRVSLMWNIEEFTRRQTFLKHWDILTTFHKFTVYRPLAIKKLVVVQNQHSIRNHHKKLHGIAYILTTYFFLPKLNWWEPQEKMAEGSAGRVLVEKGFSSNINYSMQDFTLISEIMFILHQDQFWESKYRNKVWKVKNCLRFLCF